MGRAAWHVRQAMGISRSRAAANREAILAAAERLFRERGVEAVGVNELMREAGFTHGGFYNHFASKDALVAEVVARAMGPDGDDGEAPSSPFCGDDAADLAGRIEAYLSRSHRDDLSGCELAALVCDVQRMGETAKDQFARGFRAVLDGSMRSSRGNEVVPADRGEIIARLCQMVGTLVLSRALANQDLALADQVLDASRQNLIERIEARSARTDPGTAGSSPPCRMR